MKICYLVDANTQHALRWIRHFRDTGHDIHVITVKPAVIPGVTVHIVRSLFPVERIGSGRYPRSIFLATVLPRIFYLVRRVIRPDILHSHYATSLGFIGALCRWKNHVLSVLGSDILISAAKRPMRRWAARYALRKADRVLATSRYLAKATKEIVPDIDVTVTPYGVDLTQFSPERFTIKPEETQQKLVGCFKNLKPISGIEFFIKAIPVMLKECPEVRFNIVGDGELEKKLKDMVQAAGFSHCVEFQPAVPHDRLPEILTKFRVIAIPSLSESFSVFALEAQAMGVPVTAFSVGGLKETIESGLGGFLVEKGNWQELGEKIAMILNDDILFERMSRDGKMFVKENYDWEINRTIVESIYSSL